MISFQDFRIQAEASMLANKKEGKVFVADFKNGEGKYISTVFDTDEDPYDMSLKISPRVEVRITYLTKDDKISGVQITKLSGKTLERINLSTLGFEGVLHLLQIFSDLDLKSVANKSLILDSSIVGDEEALKRHLMTILSDEKGLEALSKLAESQSIVEAISAAYRQQMYQKEIKNLEKLLELEEAGNIVESIKNEESLKEYTAGQPEKIFHKWIEKNLWVFGVDYAKKHDARKIAIASEADLLVESIDGFLDLIELKRPKLSCEFLKLDSSHKSYYPSPELSQAIGQCLLYLQKMADMKLVLEKDYKVQIIRPRVKIVIGRTNQFNSEQLKALRMLNSNLNHIQIVSYDYLLSCGRKIIANYE